jgi:glycosyltransferase involved in cell wall biosynthesis
MNMAILICTRNRPSELHELLTSVSSLETAVFQVVISSSGVDVDEIISIHRSNLSITHVNTESYGQIRQKILGIEAIDKSVDWTLFLDDDVLLPKDTIGKLEKIIKLKMEKNSRVLLGIGLSTPSTSHLRGSNTLLGMVAKSFYLDSERKGDILLSGHPVSYLEAKKITSTKWLNGISAWNTEALPSYGSDYLESRYSAFEDVIFSYSQSKIGELLYDPSINIDFQQSTVSDFSNPSIFEAASYWRLKFVLENREFSKMKFLWSQIGRSLFFIYSSRNPPKSFFMGTFKTVEIFAEILFQLVIKKNANWSLDRHCKV